MIGMVTKVMTTHHTRKTLPISTTTITRGQGHLIPVEVEVQAETMTNTLVHIPAVEVKTIPIAQVLKMDLFTPMVRMARGHTLRAAEAKANEMVSERVSMTKSKIPGMAVGLILGLNQVQTIMMKADVWMDRICSIEFLTH